jgi:hypothetical protein
MLVQRVSISAGIFAWFADPDGNTIGPLQPKR